MKRLFFATSVLSAAAAFSGCDSAGPAGAVQPHFASLYGDYFSNCAQCHSPSGPGRQPGTTETSLDFSTAATAYATLTGKAAGLSGNSAGCNGVPFIAKGKPGSSVLLAVVDASTRKSLDLTGYASCDATAITDMTLKVGKAPSAAFVTALRTWIQNGAAND